MTSRRRLAPGLAALLSAAALFPAAARAEKPKLHLQRVLTDKYPVVETYLTFVESDGRVITGKQREDFKLVFDSNDVGAAADVKSVDLVGEPIYIAIVAQISQAMHEVIDDEKRGIKQIGQAAADLKGSKGASKVTLVTYAQDFKRVLELGKPEELDGAVGGVQEDDQGAEAHLLDAIRNALDNLNSKQVPDNARKLVVVFSDGIDASGSTTDKGAFKELGKRANLAGIVIDTVGYAPFEPGKLKNLFELSKQTNGVERMCKSAQEVSAQLSNVAEEIRKQYYCVFQSPIAGDSKDHLVQILHEAGGQQVYSETISKFVPPGVVEEKKGRPWWFWLLAIGLPIILVVVIVLIVLSRRGREEPVEIVEAPKVEASPQRTMAIDLGGGSKGPTIGWIVGLNGRYTEKTFKLKPVTTVIGSSPEVDVQVEDAKVSRRHCEIRFDGYTYKIVDLGSTNGVVLNDKRTPSSDLVDGDTFRLGSTDFKFKSIN